MNETTERAEKGRESILEIANRVHKKREEGKKLDKRYNSFVG